MPITGEDMKQEVTLGPHALPPVVAVGGENDGIVMEYQLRDAAEFFGTRAVIVPGVAHDLMLVSPAAFACFLRVSNAELCLSVHVLRLVGAE